MARPKQEKTEISEAYLVDALLLAGQYAGMLREKEYFEKAFAGVQLYTAEMAIDELSGSSYSDSERVQSSNISKPAERIGILLAEGYVERKNAEIVDELLQQGAEYDDLCEKIDIIEVAMRERMAERTRDIFLQIYLKGRTFSKVWYDGGYCHNEQICREKESAIRAIAEELDFRNCVKEDSYRGTQEEGAN